MEIMTEQALEIIGKIPSVVEKCEASNKEAWSRKTVKYYPQYIDDVEKSAVELGYKSKRIYSGPGHDAQFLADCVPTTMIFVPSEKGHGYCEKE